MTTPNQPVPDELLLAALSASTGKTLNDLYDLIEVDGDDHDAMERALRAALSLHERMVREQVAREVADPFLWPDPFGNWTAEQADAARAMKEHILPRIVQGENR